MLAEARVFTRLQRVRVSLCLLHRIIMKFSGVITIYRSDVHAKGQGQGHRSQNPFNFAGPYLQVEFTYGDEMIHI